MNRERQFLHLMAAFMVFWIVPAAAMANCVCECVDGQVQVLCENATDRRPYCQYQTCPTVNYSTPPVGSQGALPLGTTSCQPTQVYNWQTRRYEWTEVCN